MYGNYVGSCLRQFVPMQQAGAGHALTQAALFEEILFQPAELLIEQVVGLVYQAKRDVGHYLGRAGFHEPAVKLVSLRDFAAKLSDIERFPGGFAPFAMVAHPQVVPVVVEQFLEAGAGHVGEFDLGFLGGESGLAAFEDVFLAGTSGLDHLVNRAVAFGEKLVSEAEGDIENDLRLVEGVEGLVVATRRKKAVRRMGGMGRTGGMGRMTARARIPPLLPIIRILLPRAGLRGGVGIFARRGGYATGDQTTTRQAAFFHGTCRRR